jgi:hypothetical protein
VKRIQGTEAMFPGGGERGFVQAPIHDHGHHSRPDLPPTLFRVATLPWGQASSDRGSHLQGADPLASCDVGGLIKSLGNERFALAIIRSKQDDQRRAVAIGQHLRAIGEYAGNEIHPVPPRRIIEQAPEPVGVARAACAASSKRLGDRRGWRRW